MKSFAKFVLIAGAAILAVQATAKAETLQCAIPFDFQAAGISLPAGEYTLISDSSTPNFVSVRNAAGRTLAFLTGHSGAGANRIPSTITFNRYGDSYFLREIRESSGQRTWYFPTSKAEREVSAGVNPTTALVIGIVRH